MFINQNINSVYSFLVEVVNREEIYVFQQKEINPSRVSNTNGLRIKMEFIFPNVKSLVQTHSVLYAIV